MRVKGPIHVHLHRGGASGERAVDDAAEGTAHDPKSGQFTGAQSARHKELTAVGHEHKGSIEGQHYYNHPKTGVRTTVHAGGEMTQTHPAGSRNPPGRIASTSKHGHFTIQKPNAFRRK